MYRRRQVPADHAALPADLAEHGPDGPRDGHEGEAIDLAQRCRPVQQTQGLLGGIGLPEDDGVWLARVAAASNTLDRPVESPAGAEVV